MGHRRAAAGQLAHQEDGLLKRLHSLSGGQSRHSQVRDAIPQPAGASIEHDAAAGQGGQGGQGRHRPGQQGSGSGREVRDVGKSRDPLGAAEDEADGRTGIHAIAEIGMIREREDVEPVAIRLLGDAQEIRHTAKFGVCTETKDNILNGHTLNSPTGRPSTLAAGQKKSVAMMPKTGSSAINAEFALRTITIRSTNCKTVRARPGGLVQRGARGAGSSSRSRNTAGTWLSSTIRPRRPASSRRSASPRLADRRSTRRHVSA